MKNETGKKTFSSISLASFDMDNSKDLQSKVFVASLAFKFTNIFNENSN